MTRVMTMTMNDKKRVWASALASHAGFSSPFAQILAPSPLLLALEATAYFRHICAVFITSGRG